MKQNSRKLFNCEGQPKYLTLEERRSFLKAADKVSPELRTFCAVLAYTGCRISEALALTADRVDISNGVIVFESLKKRKTGVYRSVPIPEALVNALEFTYSIRETQKIKNRREERLWPWGRTTAWRKIKKIMTDAGIDNEAHAVPKGLRHGVGVAAVQAGIPLNLVQKWLGTCSAYDDSHLC